MHTIRRDREGTQAKWMEARPGSESGAKAQRGILGSWESRTALLYNCRIKTTPADQRLGEEVGHSATSTSKLQEETREAVSEGNRSGQLDGKGSLSCLIVALESRVTRPEGACE